MKKIYTLKKTICVTALCLLFSLNFTAQLSGVRNIPSPNFLTIAVAIDSLNTYGVAAPGITFNVAPNHTETFPNITAGLISMLPSPPSVLRPVVFQKAAGAGSNPLITASVGSPLSGFTDGIVVLNGVDFVTFNRIDLIENPINSAALTIADSTFEWGYALLKSSGVNGCQNITIQNCNVTLNVNNMATIGIYSNNHTPTSTTQLVVTSTAGANSHNLFTGNRLSGLGRGIHVTGYNDLVAPYAFYDQNNEVGQIGANRNTIIVSLNAAGGTNAFGVYAESQNNLRVVNDSIFVFTTAVGMAPVGNSPSAINTDIGINSNLDISNNLIIVKSLSSSYPGYAIRNISMGTNGNVNINNNVVRDAVWPSYGISQTLRGIENAAPALNLSLSNNLFTNISCGTPCGGFVAIRNTGNVTNTITVSSNSLTANNLHGGLYSSLYYNSGTSLLCTISNNYIDANTINGSAIFNGIFIAATSDNNSVQTNTLINTTITGTASVAMVRVQSNLSTTVTQNYMANVASAGGSVTGVNVLGGANVNITRNKIYNLSSSGLTGNVCGITVAGGTVINISNNMIGNLTAPASSNTNAVIGLQLNGGTTINAFYNTVNLNANSTGTDFGSSGIVTNTTSVISLINNLIHNASVPNGTAMAVAHRRNGSSLTSLSVSSNNNLYFANVALGGNRFTYFDGTTPFSTIANYTAAPGMAPREAASITGNQQVVSPNDLHLVLASTVVQSMGTAILINTDIDGATRNTSCPEIGAHEAWNCLIVLPIEISTFDAECIDIGAKINWTSESRKENEKYTLEKSIDAADFRELSNLKISTDANKPYSYSTIDNELKSGNVYYRLAHTDAAKQKTYSKVVALMCTEAKSEITLYPNPCNGIFSVILNGTIGENSEIIITDAMNRTIEKRSVIISENNQRVNSDLTQYPTGIYFVSVKNANQSIIKKLVQQN